MIYNQEYLLFNQIFLLLIVATTATLSYWVYRANPKNEINRLFAIISMVFLFWWIGGYFFSFSENLDFSLVLGRIILGVVSISFTSLYYFIQIFPSETNKKNNKSIPNIFIAALALLFFILPVFTDLIVKDVKKTPWGVDPLYGEWQVLYYIWIALIMALIFAQIFHRYFQVANEDKLKIQYFFTGFSIFTLMNLVFNVIFPLWQGSIRYWQFGNWSALFVIIFTTYAIVRYRLMDIKYLIFRAIGFASLASTFFAIYGAFLYVTLPYIQALNLSATQYTVLGIINTALAIPVYRYYRLFLQRATDRFLFQGRTDYRLSLLKVTSQLSRTIKIEEVNHIIMDAMRDIMRSEKTLIFLQDTSKQTYHLRGQYNSRLRSDIAASNMLVQHLYTAQGPVFKDEMAIYSEQMEGRHPARSADIKAAGDVMQWLDISVAIPLFVDKGLIGFILLGSKLSGEQYQGEEVTFLAALAPQAATALENARLYKESLEFAEKLNTEVKRATHDLQAANVQLMDMDKAKSEFLNIASHQLYTPITALRGYVSMMIEGDFGKVAPEQMEVLKILMKSATRLIELIKNLLDISRIESGRFELKLEQVDISFMAKELVQDLMPNAMNKKLQLEYHKPPEGTFEAIADQERLRQVMLNFIDNAVKYTNEGRVDVNVKREGDNIIFFVTDTGKGISQDDLKKLFTKFTRVGGASRYHTEGTGLGLYVARQIIREHHGEVEADSPGEGKGSTFTMVIPAAQTPGSLKLGDKATVEIKAAESGQPS